MIKLRSQQVDQGQKDQQGDPKNDEVDKPGLVHNRCEQQSNENARGQGTEPFREYQK